MDVRWQQSEQQLLALRRCFDEYCAAKERCDIAGMYDAAREGWKWANSLWFWDVE